MVSVFFLGLKGYKLMSFIFKLCLRLNENVLLGFEHVFLLPLYFKETNWFINRMGLINANVIYLTRRQNFTDTNLKALADDKSNVDQAMEIRV